jgi:trk system potassium uptake protein TrkH
MNLNYRLMMKICGIVSLVMGAGMIPCLFVASLYKEWDAFRMYCSLIIILAIVGWIVYLMNRNANPSIRIRDGLLIVSMVWFLICIIGALPYYISGLIPSFSDAFVESASGFTTTGHSLLEELEKIPKCMMFWRALTHWIGGMGILIFALSIFPALGVGTYNLANAETSGSALERIKSRISEQAKRAYLIYAGFTILAFLFLVPSGMGPFNAILYALDSMGNGGFRIYSEGVRHFDSVYIESVVGIFCLFGSLNFFAYMHLVQGKVRDFFREREIRAYLMILMVSSVSMVVVLILQGPYETVGESVKNGVLQVVSFSTTAGYVVSDYALWPGFCKWLLFFLMIIGGCSSSTSGGFKVVRFAVILQLIRRNINKRLHPNAVMAVKVGQTAVAADAVSTITVFGYVYMLVIGVSTLFLGLDGKDALTTLSAVISSISNSGLGFGELADGNLGLFSPLARFFLSLLMIVGRLEIFTVLILFTPSFWKPNR